MTLGDDLIAHLTAAWSAPTVEEIGGGRFLVSVPSHRFEHDTRSVVVTHRLDEDRPWSLSDDGELAFLLGDRYGHLRETLVDSPVVSVHVGESEVTATAAADVVGDAVLAFVREVEGLLIAAGTLDAYVVARRAAGTADRQSAASGSTAVILPATAAW